MLVNHKIIGEGAPLYILHGLFGSLDNWNSLGKRFAAERQVILVDQRNHGRSFHDEAMNYGVMAQDLVALMDHLGHDKADLLGHSMGGKTVMKVAMDYPERIHRLIVADIGPREYESHHDAIIEALFSVDLEQVESRGQVQEIMASQLSNQGVIQFLTKNLYWKERGQLAWRMNLPVLAEHLEEILASIGEQSYEGASLFLRGSESDYIPDEDLMPLHMQFLSSEVYTMQGAGHWLHAEKPDEFYERVSEYLRSAM